MLRLKAHVPSLPRHKKIANLAEVITCVGTHQRIFVISIATFLLEIRFCPYLLSSFNHQIFSKHKAFSSVENMCYEYKITITGTDLSVRKSYLQTLKTLFQTVQVHDLTVK